MGNLLFRASNFWMREMFYHSCNEHPWFSKIVKFGFKMLWTVENTVLWSLQILYTFYALTQNDNSFLHVIK